MKSMYIYTYPRTTLLPIQVGTLQVSNSTSDEEAIEKFKELPEAKFVSSRNLKAFDYDLGLL